MNKNLKEIIAPQWIEEQQGVYIPLIDRILLKKQVSKMSYHDYIIHAKKNNIQIATKKELLQIYLQKEEINDILKKHNGDLLQDWYGSSSEYDTSNMWIVSLNSGYCSYTYKSKLFFSRVVIKLK